MAQAIGKAMANLVVLECHLWLYLTEIRDHEKMAFLDSPVSPKGLLSSAMDGFAEHFTEAQTQVLRHFLPKHSSAAAASCQKTIHTAGTTSAPAEIQACASAASPDGQMFPYPKHQGPRLLVVLDPEPQKPSCAWLHKAP